MFKLHDIGISSQSTELILSVKQLTLIKSLLCYISLPGDGVNIIIRTQDLIWNYKLKSGFPVILFIGLFELFSAFAHGNI